MIFTNKEMLAREKEKNYFGTYEKANTHMEKQEEDVGWKEKYTIGEEMSARENAKEAIASPPGFVV